jgi:hypothetical protein
MIHPKNITGEEIAIFIHDINGTCGGSAVLFGIARFENELFYVERSTAPLKFPIPTSAWQSLKPNESPNAESTFGCAAFIVRLILGSIPDGDILDDYSKIDIPILQQD